jgi:hypothetical protein
MIIEEIRTAHALKKKNGKPVILPVRLAYTGDLSYDLGSWLNRIEYLLWSTGADDPAILDKIASVIGNGEAVAENLPLQAAAAAAAGAGMAPAAGARPPNPMPAFDPQWLEQLDGGDGPVLPSSPFYVERSTDQAMKKAVVKSGVTLRIKGGRQTGKTSTLSRIVQHARTSGQQDVYLDFQRMDDQHLKDLDSVLRYIAEVVARRLRTNAKPAQYWDSPLGSKDKLNDFLISEVLDHAAKPLVLVLDEVDRVFKYSAYRSDFFGLVRSWHTARAFESQWEMLNIVLAYSTEATLLITDENQSPFNIGDSFEALDFTNEQVSLLNFRHNSPVKTQAEMDDLMELVGGHPFLTRKALYELAAHNQTFAGLQAKAHDDDGPFSDHLHHYRWWLRDRAQTRADLKTAIKEGACATNEGFYELRSIGLIAGHNREKVMPRCGLYGKYFGRIL